MFSRFGNSARHRRLRGRLLRHRHRLLRHRHHHHHAKEDGKKRKLFFCSAKTGDVERTSRGDRSTVHCCPKFCVQFDTKRKAWELPKGGVQPSRDTADVIPR